MSFSNQAKINFNKLNMDEALLVCLEISHSFLADPIYLVNDSRNLVSDGKDHIAMPFSVKRQNDVQGELPRAALIIPNIGRELVKWIDSSGGGKGASIIVKLIRRSAPDVVEESLSFGISTVTVTTQNVTINLIVQNNLVKRACRLVYDKIKAAGLF